MIVLLSVRFVEAQDWGGRQENRNMPEKLADAQNRGASGKEIQ
jgi:hypothetical protein